MVTTKVFGIAIITALIMSCTLSGITGSKNVIKQNRKITENFNSVKVSTGIDLYITQGSNKKVSVEADDNIIDLIITKVEGNVLKIYFEKNVRKAKSKKVYIVMPQIVSLKATSGASIEGEKKIESENLELSASSGAEIQLKLQVTNLTCKSSSGAEVEISGNSLKFDANANSGAEIDAEDLKSVNVTAKASSGAEITIIAQKSIDASASSGGHIKYKGNPTEKNISKSSGGGISRK